MYNSVIKNIWLKHKRILLAALAVLFLVVLFLLKTTTVFKNTETYQSVSEDNGLTYSNTTVQDLINKDTDGDGILDWQESLYGLDPAKKETTPGTKDSVAIEKLSAQSGSASGGKQTEIVNNENLTETDKFSRELFATVAAASQNGVMDQATIDALGASLSEKIQNSPPRKIFLVSEIKIINDDSVQAFRNYNNALNNINKKYPATAYTILDVLQEFVVDENNVDVDILIKLNPIIDQTNKIIIAMKGTNVPQSISNLHLSIMNGLERLSENLSDIKLYESDAIVALGGISKYQENSNELELNLNNLANAINQKLKN